MFLKYANQVHYKSIKKILITVISEKKMCIIHFDIAKYKHINGIYLIKCHNSSNTNSGTSETKSLR